MSTAIGVLGSVILFVIGLAFLIPGIIGTAVTSKTKRFVKPLRVLFIICLILGIAFCAAPLLVYIFTLLV